MVEGLKCQEMEEEIQTSYFRVIIMVYDFRSYNQQFAPSTYTNILFSQFNHFADVQLTYI